jgi:hypothetical protein
MKNYLNFINETKLYQNLYHIIDFEKLNFILDNNCIKNYNFQYISTTRDKMLNNYLGAQAGTVFKLELNFEKLNNKFKIKPFVYKSNTDIYFYGEKEEKIYTNKIDNAFNYINKVILIKDNVERLKNTGWFSSDGAHSKIFYELEKRNSTLPENLKLILDKLKKYNIDLYVQDGSVIKKDDNYINSILNFKIKIINHAYEYFLRQDISKPTPDGYSRIYNVSTPLTNTKNPTITDLVVGYEYDNLYLNLNLPNKPTNVNDKELYIFDFIYQDSDIIDIKNNIIHLKTAKLDNIEPF